jgi:cytoskeleton protein RodZ
LATSGKSENGQAARTADEAREFGAALREMRIAHGRELTDAAEHLRIRKVYLQAIEEGRFDDLPGPTYAAGFVRAYADYLGLDVNEVVRRFRQAVQGVTTQAQLVPPSPVTEGRLPTGSVLLVAAIIAAAAYGAWYYVSSEGQNPGEIVAALPERIAAMVGMGRDSAPESPVMLSSPSETSPAASVQLPAAVPAPAPAPREAVREPPEPARAVPERQAAGESAPAVPEAAVAAAPAPAPAPAAPRAAEAPAGEATSAPVENVPGSERVVTAPLPTAPPAPARPEPPPAAPEVEAVPPPTAPVTVAEPPPALPEQLPQEAAVPPAADGAEARVVLRATASTWVEIRDGDGRRVFSRLMRAGEIYTVPPRAGITLTTGNAGGIDLVVDGRTMPPLGAAGGVRRDVLLDAEALLSRSPSP